MLQFLAGFAFCMFLAGILSSSKESNEDEFNSNLLTENEELNKLVLELQAQLDLPDHKRMEVSEFELQNLRSKLQRSKERNKILRNDIKLLNSFLDSVKGKRGA